MISKYYGEVAPDNAPEVLGPSGRGNGTHSYPGNKKVPPAPVRAAYSQVMAASTAATTRSATPTQMRTWSILTAPRV